MVGGGGYFFLVVCGVAACVLSAWATEQEHGCPCMLAVVSHAGSGIG
jgi:hypothetical protein